MSIRKSVAMARLSVARIKREIKTKVASLPDNPRIKRLPGIERCFTISNKDLGNNWSPEYHDFREQYRFICDQITRVHFTKIIPFLKRIIEKGVIYETNTTRTRHTFHPDAIEYLKGLINER